MKFHARAFVRAAVGTFFFPILQSDLGLFPTLLIIAAGCVAAAGVTVAFRARAHAGVDGDSRTMPVDPAGP